LFFILFYVEQILRDDMGLWC